MIKKLAVILYDENYKISCVDRKSLKNIYFNVVKSIIFFNIIQFGILKAVSN